MISADTTSVYFSVPGNYGYGPEFDTMTDALTHAQAQIREIDGCPGAFTRAFVEVRVKDATGDRPIHREEVFLPGQQPPAGPSVETVLACADRAYQAAVESARTGDLSRTRALLKVALVECDTVLSDSAVAARTNP